MSDLQREHLCAPCKSILLYRCEETSRDHHVSLDALFLSSKKCALCAFLLTLVLEKIMLPEYIPFMKQIKFHVSRRNMQYSNADTFSDARLHSMRFAWDYVAGGWFIFDVLLAGGTGPITQSLLWNADAPISFEERLPLLKQWLTECEHGHETCRDLLQQWHRPKRLLYLGEPEGPLELKLVYTQSLEPNLRYSSLSHCWGSANSHPLRTTKANEQSHLDGIPAERIPLTFRDAINITRSLGICFIWIDSLCIVQDNLEEWQIEAARMCDIYRGGFLNIAASDAVDCNGGCFLDSQKPPIRMQSISSAILGMPSELSIRAPGGNHQDVDQSHLSTRGWALQESVLAKRTLHCSKRQFYWRCRSFFGSEDGSIHHDPMQYIYRVASDVAAPSQIVTVWWDWVKDMCRREFTVDSDRLAALAGITKLYQEKTRRTPALGLWSETLTDELDWTVLKLTPGDAEWRSCPRSGIPCIPSWTWLSRKMCEFQSGATCGEQLALVQEIDVQWNGEPYTSGIKASTLIIHGRLASILVKLSLDGSGITLDLVPSQGGAANCYLDEVIPSFQVGEAVHLVPCLVLKKTQQTANPIRGSFGHPEDSDFFTLLLLAEVSQNDSLKKQYRRIGLGYCKCEGQYRNLFETARFEAIELV